MNEKFDDFDLQIQSDELESIEDEELWAELQEEMFGNE